MDDFLHNLRSGKLKQNDQNRRNYQDQQFKNTQRRGTPERRKRDQEIAISSENMAVIKDVLENISSNQKRIANALENRSSAEERKASALEKIAENLGTLLKPYKTSIDATDNLIPFNENVTSIEEKAAEHHIEPELEASIESSMDSERKLSENDREKVAEIIQHLRDERVSYEKIAHHLEEEGYPTLSGKGKWRGQTVQRLFLKTSR